ncbi:MAG: hypothetical protein AAFO69_13290, partial [Bacteroidota bacterium]
DATYPPFFILQDQSVYSIGTKKEILKYLDGRGEYKEFVKQHKLKMTEKQDLIQLFSHANESDQRTIKTFAGDGH